MPQQKPVDYAWWSVDSTQSGFMEGSMFRNIMSKPETRYLGFGLMMPWENNLEIQFNLWKDGFASGKINRLKEIV